MGTLDPKAIMHNVPLGGVAKGISSFSAHILRPGEVKDLNNFMFKEAGAETRLGWNTVEQSGGGAFTSWYSYPGSQSNGVGYADLGSFVGYAINDDTKIVAFQEEARLQDNTLIYFTGSNAALFSKPATLPWLGVVHFASTFLLYTEEALYSIRSGITGAGFTGSGLNDMTSNSSDYLDNSKILSFKVEIDSTGAIDTFRWSNDGGVNWDQSGVEITGLAQELSDGVKITFAAVTGHTLNDYWTFVTGPSKSGNELVEEVNFKMDLGFEFGPIIGLFARYGQLWVVSKSDRLFWSAALKYKITGGVQIEDHGLEKTWTVWQSVYGGPIFSMDKVEYMSFFKASLTIASGYQLTNGTDYAFVLGVTSDWDAGDILYPEGQSETKTITSPASTGVKDVATVPHNAITAGDTWIDIPTTADTLFMYRAFKFGAKMTVTEGANSETFTIGVVTIQVDAWRIFFQGAPTTVANNYTVAAVITIDNTIRLGFTANWGANYNPGNIVKDVWADVPDTDYDVSLDPDNDPNANGHIRFKETSTVKNAEGLRCSFTPVDNAWTGIGSGVWDIAPDQGDNITYAQGPNAREQEGAAVIYLFKTNGDIHAITGRPGIQGGPGNMDANVVATGIIARNNSARTTLEGVYFGAINGVTYNVYFIPHGSKLAGREQVPMLTESFEFDNHLPLDDSSYTIEEKAFIIDGNKYAIFFPFYTGSNVPLTNGHIYIGQAYKEGDTLRGRWSRMSENSFDEYQDSSGNTIAAIGGAASTEGFYFHQGTLCRVYKVRAGYNYTGDAYYYYELATYGWYDGGEECKDRYVYTYDAGGGSYITERATSYFWAKIKQGMSKIAERITITKLYVDQDVIGGTEADGIDMLIDIFTDLNYSKSELEPENPIKIADLTDEEEGLRILIGLDFKINCKYFQFEFTWKNIKYRDRPARIFYRDSALEVTVLTPKGKLSEEDV